ncbi:colicin D domain-containing protein [Pannonibacter phragmitetus]|uniref:colicin D domain-containing protein n=1 Tax=Pannonibacter phragmitetus TaxID=121719 RepID=UPI003D2F3F21
MVRDGDGNGVTAAKLRAEADAAEASGDPATAAALREQADAEEASDKAATDTQLASINRDLDTVIEVTRETEEGFDLYVSDTSVKAALEAGKTVKEIIGDVLDQLVADDRLSIEDARAAKLIASHADDPEVLAQLAVCGQRRSDARPSLFDWLIPPAYAAMSCEISIGGEMVIIPPDVALTCLQIVQQVKGAVTLARALAVGLSVIPLIASTTKTGGAIDETQTLADGTVVRLTGYGSDRIRKITATSPDGVVSVLEVEATGYGYTLIGGAVDGKPMTPGQLRSAALQASGGEVQVVYNDAPGKGHNGGPEYNEDDTPGGNGGNNGNGNGPNLPPVVPGKSGDSSTSGGTGAPNTVLPSYSTRQLQHEFKHAADFGVRGSWNRVNGEAFQRAIDQHISDPATTVIQGTYRGQAVTHHFNPNTGNNVFVRPDGSFWGGWKLSPDQITNITSHGGLR